MFNKKENIEDDFMGYNSNNSKDNGNENDNNSGGLGSTIQLLIIFILLGVIAAGGFFGYKYTQDSTLDKSANVVKESKPVAVVQPVAAPVTVPVKSAQTEQKMYTQDQMQAIVKMMMSNMNKKTPETNIESESESNTDDNELINSLTNIDVDQMDDILTDNSDEADTTQKVTSSGNDKIDRYNKVVLENTNSDLNDLSSQLNSAIEDLDQKSSEDSTYTKSISKEVTTRINEMRVLIVKNGDSLSKIAARAYGSASAYGIIMKANPDLIKNPNRIYVGQRLRVPLIAN